MAETASATLDDVVNSIIEKIRATCNYAFLTASAYLSYCISGLAGPVTGAAMMLGRVILDLKKSIKTKWAELYKEGIKGLILGNLTKLFYQYVISIIPNETLYGKICRTLAFNPGYLGAVYHPVYLKTTHLLDGTQHKKGEWGSLVKKNLLLSPFHYLTANYLNNVQQQAGAAAFIGTAYRVIAG